ncbi:MAG: hypothetical protein ACYC43_10730, partial [Burkholderiales bacterium]
QLGYPAVNDSVAGYKDFNDVRYLNLIGSAVNRITLEPQPAAQASLVDANGALVAWRQQDRQTDMSFDAYVSLDFTLRQPGTCLLYDQKGFIVRPASHNNQQFHYHTHATGRHSFRLRC